MVKINENFLNLQENYLFSTVAKKVKEYQQEHLDKKLIRLGIGDVTRPIPKVITDAIKNATEEMNHQSTFRGYGPEQGYEFLRQKIIQYDYYKRGIQLEIDEVFVSDGAKCDTGNIIDLFDRDNVVAIADPVYPVYLDTNIIAGRSVDVGNIIYMKLTEENGFEPVPEELEKQANIIYICSPNNPTGTVLSKETLERWVSYAKKHHSIILYDAAYEAYIQDEQVPHSIYEIEGAKEVAIEFRSFSKTAGFTGLRCAYTVVPKQILINGISMNQLWNRRTNTKFNGVSYIIQRGAEAIYSKEGQKEIKKNILYYQENAMIIRYWLQREGIKAYGGKNAPYIWMKVPNGMKSWEFFDKLLKEAGIVGTPGVGFGPSGEGYFRLTAFGSREDTKEAMKRIKELSI